MFHGATYFVAFAFTFPSTPRIVITADNPSPNRLAFHIASPGPSGFTLRSSESSLGTPTPFTVLLHTWAWRQHGVA
ncbi:hypothetical protein [Nonomuraea dietziae]|uniref:hypothetical protein n=1 Tax=Nonomuraea dietziae TaxID=65515 RepID=UPI0033F6C8C1